MQLASSLLGLCLSPQPELPHLHLGTLAVAVRLPARVALCLFTSEMLPPRAREGACISDRRTLRSPEQLNCRELGTAWQPSLASSRASSGFGVLFLWGSAGSRAPADATGAAGARRRCSRSYLLLVLTPKAWEC